MLAFLPVELKTVMFCLVTHSQPLFHQFLGSPKSNDNKYNLLLHNK